MSTGGLIDQFKDAFRRRNNATIQLILINAVVFLLFDGLFGVTMTVIGQKDVYETVQTWLYLPSSVLSPLLDGWPYLLRQPWSLVTNMFMHDGLWHLASNLIGLYIFGRIVQEYLGSQKVINLFVLGGLAGALFFLAFHNIPLFDAGPAVLLGASGGVLAIVVGAATLLPNYSIRLLLLGPIKLKYIAIVYVVITFFGLAEQAERTTNVSHITHLGGAVFGYFYILSLQKGKDYGAWLVKVLDWFKHIFKPKSKIRVTYRNPNPKGTSSRSSRNPSSSTSSRPSGGSTAKSSEISQDEIDAILDKITEGGYDSLTKEEKQKLFNAGK